ncbi:MAG: sortase [Actinobacteria bacterium]|nr:sortase [Actinomycetota bacterium]
MLTYIIFALAILGFLMMVPFLKPYLVSLLKWLGLRRIIGVLLVVIGIIILIPFITPYYYLYFGPVAKIGKISKDNRIYIPSVKINAKISEGATKENLLFDVAHVERTALPGQEGNSVIIGHNKGHPSNLLFTFLYKTKTGDLVAVDYKKKRYAYKIKKIKIIDPEKESEEIKAMKGTLLTLITCYPPNTNYYRIIVIAKPL